MDLTGILSISGYGGLFKLIKQTKTGFIVESLIDEKRMQAFASSKISTLDDIAIFTETAEMHLKDVLKKIFEQLDGKKTDLTSKSSSEELKAFLESVLPDYDKERVYVSDIKKLVGWYNLLVEKDLVDLEEDEDESGEEKEKQETKKEDKEEIEEKTDKKVEEKKQVKKAPAKKKQTDIKDKKKDTKKKE